jgi:hypothetical protein
MELFKKAQQNPGEIRGIEESRGSRVQIPPVPLKTFNLLNVWCFNTINFTKVLVSK